MPEKKDTDKNKNKGQKKEQQPSKPKILTRDQLEALRYKLQKKFH